MYITDGAAPEKKEVFLAQVGHCQIKTITTTEGVTFPSAKIEFRHNDHYRNDGPSTQFEHIVPVQLEPYEARLLAETLITAAEAGETALKKARKRKSGKPARNQGLVVPLSRCCQEPLETVPGGLITYRCSRCKKSHLSDDQGPILR